MRKIKASKMKRIKVKKIPKRKSSKEGKGNYPRAPAERRHRQNQTYRVNNFAGKKSHSLDSMHMMPNNSIISPT